MVRQQLLLLSNHRLLLCVFNRLLPSLSVLKVVFSLWADLASVKCVTLTSHHRLHTRTRSTDKGFYIFWHLCGGVLSGKEEQIDP